MRYNLYNYNGNIKVIIKNRQLTITCNDISLMQRKILGKFIENAYDIRIYALIVHTVQELMNSQSHLEYLSFHHKIKNISASIKPYHTFLTKSENNISYFQETISYNDLKINGK